MRLSMIFELLLIFVLVAFAASKSVEKHSDKKIALKRKNEKQENEINKFCKCSDGLCNCCREFQIPLVNINGPGCAAVRYLAGDKMAISLSFGERVITNRTISGNKPKPVCMPIPGGISKFCGRVYNIARKNEEFRACLGLELQSKNTVEAAVRVSCFNFGAKGVTSEQADPLPLVPEQQDGDDDDDDDDEDDDDTFGLADDDDDDFDDDDDDDEDDDATETENDVGDTEYGGFSIIGDDLLGGIFDTTSGNKKKPNKKKQIAITSGTTSTTKRPRTRRTPSTTTRKAAATRTTTKRASKRPITARPNRPTRTTQSSKPRRKTTTKTTPSLPTSSEIFTQNDIVVSNELPQTTAEYQMTSNKPTENNIQDKLQSSLENYLEPVVLVTQKPTKRPQGSTISLTTQKTSHVTNIEPGIQLSLADITGQLSEMPVTTIVSASKANRGDSEAESQNVKPYTIEMTTNRESSPLMFTSSVEDGMIEVVESFEDNPTSKNPTSEDFADDEETKVMVDITEADDDKKQDFVFGLENDGEYLKSINRKRKNKKQHKQDKDDEDDDDLLGLSFITDTLGITGGKRNRNRLTKDKVVHPTTTRNLKKEDEDGDDFLGIGALSETLGFRTLEKKKDKTHKKRQNKMMKGDWFQLDSLI